MHQTGIRFNHERGPAKAIGQQAPIREIMRKKERALELALAAARVAHENKGREIVVLDLRPLTPMSDFFVIATGDSRRQLHAISEEIDDVLQKNLGDRRMGLEGYDESRWILLDYGNVVVHLFDDETRKFYDLEGLWSEAKRVDLAEIIRHGAEA